MELMCRRSDPVLRRIDRLELALAVIVLLLVGAVLAVVL